MRNPFTAHPHSIGETYFEHARFASCSGVKMLVAGIACIIHGLLPFLFVYTGSQAVAELSERFTKRNK